MVVASRLMPQLALAGVRELKFVGKTTAVDQLGRKMVFICRHGQWTFEIS